MKTDVQRDVTAMLACFFVIAQVVDFVTMLMVHVIVFQVGLAWHAVHVVQMDFSGKTADSYVNARMMVHAITSMECALVNLDGLGKCVLKRVQ